MRCLQALPDRKHYPSHLRAVKEALASLFEYQRTLAKQIKKIENQIQELKKGSRYARYVVWITSPNMR